MVSVPSFHHSPTKLDLRSVSPVVRLVCFQILLLSAFSSRFPSKGEVGLVLCSAFSEGQSVGSFFERHPSAVWGAAVVDYLLSLGDPKKNGDARYA